METKQMEVMRTIENGATVWGYVEASAIRELQKTHPTWVTIIANMKELERILGVKFDGAKRPPYFGAILTDEGKEALAKAGT